MRRSSPALAAALVSAAALASVVGWAQPAGAQFTGPQQYYDPTVAFEAASPSCEAHPDARWIGHLAGTSRRNVRNHRQSVSFEGCFPTREDCVKWLQRGSGLIDGTVRLSTCTERSR